MVFPPTNWNSLGIIVKLNLGVIVVPEPNENGKDIDSWQLGVELETRYGLFSNFYKLHQKDINTDIENALNLATKALIEGKTPERAMAYFSSAGDAITHKLHNFISLREIENMGIPGVPTQAALEGLTLRTKTGKVIKRVRKGMKYKQVIGERRPSFMYSGVFESSLKAWIE